MKNVLPRLRNDIDAMPSPSPEQPGLLLRDPFHYTQAMLIIPPVLVSALAFLDGENTYLDLQTFLTQQIGQLVPSEVVVNFVSTLDQQGFLVTERFKHLRESCQQHFRDSAQREPSHAGSAYPNDPAQLSQELNGYMQFVQHGDPPGMIGIAAPHVSVFGGWRSYASAYARLDPSLADKTFVVLGTSHYGQPEKFGLTRKPFVTPLGRLETDSVFVDWIASRAGNSVVMEDYCHSVEHSIEFQCLFLQHVVSPNCRIVPILCGAFHRSLMTGEDPEADPGVRQFFDTLGEFAERQGPKLFWILGIDLAHIGRRYGDSFPAEVEKGPMAEVHEKDSERLKKVCAGNAQEFLELVKPNGDDLRWCGYSPLYTFLRAVPGARGNVLNYEQWNIDPESVVSFTALEFLKD